MNSHLVLKSVVFIVEGLLLMLALAAAVHFEIGRLLLAIAVGAVCAFGEIFVIAKIGQRLWKWSGRITSRLVLRRTARVEPERANRGEA
jgi:hypothetical protein